MSGDQRIGECAGARRSHDPQGRRPAVDPADEQEIVEADDILGQQTRKVDGIRLLGGNPGEAQCVGQAAARVHENDSLAEPDRGRGAAARGVLMPISSSHGDDGQAGVVARVERCDSIDFPLEPPGPAGQHPGHGCDRDDDQERGDAKLEHDRSSIRGIRAVVVSNELDSSSHSSRSRVARAQGVPKIGGPRTRSEAEVAKQSFAMGGPRA
jgi:hypothetical protein